MRIIDAYRAIDMIDEWLDSVGTVLVGKGLSSYGELIGCIEDTPTLTPPNEPLTLDELREMDGEPVWVEDVKHWALIDIEKGGQWDGVPFAIWAENGMKFTYNIKNRGLHCYRRPPEGEEDA